MHFFIFFSEYLVNNLPIKQSLDAIFFSNPHKGMKHSTVPDLFLFDIYHLTLKL